MTDRDLLHYLESFLTESRKARLLEVLNRRTSHFTVATEDVFQMHNASAVMRSCEVFGVQRLNVIEQRFGKRIDKEIAMGAQKWVDIMRFSSVAACVASLKSEGYQIVATTPHAEGADMDDFDITPRSALFFGTESEGLSKEIVAAADAYIKIPMYGFTESLNISVSAAIILQNLTSRLRKSGVDWQLSDVEMLEKRMQWARNSIKDCDRIVERWEMENGKW
jgi:tRNA (guanosine-2'-O-)-methyltransferase